jgi:hypothetical protein
MASITSLIILADTVLASDWLRQKMHAHATVSLPARRIGSGAMLMRLKNRILIGTIHQSPKLFSR